MAEMSRRDRIRLAYSHYDAIVEAISQGKTKDALNRLQDFARDFDPKHLGSIVTLQELYEAYILQEETETDSQISLERIHTDAIFLADCVLDSVVLEWSPATGNDARREISVSAADVESESALDRLFNIFRQRWDDPSSIVASVSGIRKTFDEGRSFELEPISFDLKAGQVTGIFGRNASGKTTLLRLLLGQLKPDQGSLRFPGLTRGGNKWREIKRQIAYVPQVQAPWRGVLRQHLNYVAATNAKKGQNVRDLVDEAVARFGLGRYQYGTWGSLSGGYATRFELVRALISQPKLLILDEPLAHLDVVAIDQFLRDLQSIAMRLNDPIPIVITSQHVNQVEAIAQQLILLDNGRTVFCGPREKIAENAKVRVFEIAIKARRESLEAALSGIELIGVETTVEGYVLAFDLKVDMAVVLRRLRVAFDTRMTAIRDVTGSARSLMLEASP